MKPIESQQRSLTIQQAVTQAAAQLEQSVGFNSAVIEARILLLSCIGCHDFSTLTIRQDETLDSNTITQFNHTIDKRLKGIPIAYIIGWKEFYNHRFKTTPSALIPRCETELLVDLILCYIPERKKMTILELGTGCGAIAISVALARPEVSVVATDYEESTLNLAKQNASDYCLDIAFHQADWYSTLSSSKFDVIVSNPPYIADDDVHLQQGDLRFEPKIALTSGKDGLQALAHIIKNAPTHLKRGGILLVENGYNQSKAVAQLFAAAGFCGIFPVNDLSHHERVSVGFLP